MTGGGRGLGRAYALHLAALGADVAVLDVDTRSYRDFERESAAMTAESTALEIEAIGRRSLEFQADVADAAAVQAAVDAVVTEWGRLDIAVCNAGGGLGSPAESRASTLDLARRAQHVDPVAHDLLAPYAGWVGFATALNASIARRNR